MDKLQLDIVTPHGPVFTGEVDEITASGSEGDFGVLPGHANMVTTLKVGIIQTKVNGKPEIFFVNTGYAEVGPDKVLVLADSSEKAESIDIQRAKAAKERAEERLRKAENVDYGRAQAALERAVTRIQIAEKGH